MFDGFDVHALLQQIADVQSTTFVVKDLEHRFVLVSAGLSAALGLTDEQMIGRNDLEVGFPEHWVLGSPNGGYPGFWALDDAAIALGRAQRRHDDGALCDPHAVRDGPPGAVGASTREPGHETDGARRTETLRTPLFDRDGEVAALLVQSSDVGRLVELRHDMAGDTATLARRAGPLPALDEVIAPLIGERDLDLLLRRAARIVVERTVADSAFVWLLHETGDYLEVVESVSPAAGTLLGARIARGEGVVGRAWELGETVYLADTELCDGTRGTWAPGTELCAVPMFDDDGVCGMLMATSPADAERLEHGIAAFERLANVAAIAIVNAWRADAARGELTRARAVSELGRLLSRDTGPADGLDAVCRTLLTALDVSRVGIYLADDTGALAPRAVWATGPDGPVPVAPTIAHLVGETIGQWCHDHGRSAHLARDAEDPRESSRAHALRRSLRIGATLAAPILVGGRSIGMLAICRHRDRCDFAESETHAFDAIATQLSTALERHELTTALDHLAHHDSLTGLANRRRFEAELARTLADPAAHGAAGAVLFLDLDGFKRINDTHGHAVGDRLLHHAGCRLTRRVHERDVIARMGGDEFAVIVRGPDAAERAAGTAQALLEALAAPFDIDGARLTVGVSIGLGRYPDDATTAEALLRRADVAMYRAKHDGKGRVVDVDRAHGTDSARDPDLTSALREAMARRRLSLVYRPQVRCGDGRVAGVEVLVRWHHPELGAIPPAKFLSVAERAGLTGAIGAWVLDEAARQLAAWDATALAGLPLAVDVAAAQLLEAGFPDAVLAALAGHGVDPCRLVLELSEGAVMRDVDTVIRPLEALRSAGVRIAIDDFGTGHASLGHLHALPLDRIKIDRSVIARLHGEGRDRSLASTIVLLASGLGLDTVADGVEGDGQRLDVEAIGCDLAQGPLFASPVEAAQLPALVARLDTEAEGGTRHARAA